MPLTPHPWNWKQPLQELPPAPDAPFVRLGLAGIPPDAALLASLRAHLSTDEHARLARLQRTGDQHRFLIGRALLREVLGAHLKQPPASLVFRAGPAGKPFIVTPPGTAPLHFNLSHSGNLVLVAFSATHEVGIDVERLDPSTDCAAVAERIFPPDDYRAWSSLPPAGQLPAFFQLWTRHEARLKALGHGLAESPDDASIAALPCIDLTLPSGYAGAVAFRAPPPPTIINPQS